MQDFISGMVMPLNTFIIRPFGTKPVGAGVPHISGAEKALEQRLLVHQGGNSAGDDLALNFDKVQELLIDPALRKLRIVGATTGAVIEAGNIREDMFSRLLTADLVIVDLTLANPNVYYELGVRQAFRDKYTFLIRAPFSPYPFDLQTDRYFEYDVCKLATEPEATVRLLVEALRRTLASNKPDSPVFKLLPGLEAEERGRFISVPPDFLEEVERARANSQREHLAVMAVECEPELWGIEGLRAIGRAQFACNFMDGAKATWEQIVQRYPDDVEANTTLSTVYQRERDGVRSEQALARARTSCGGERTSARRSQLRALTGRNFKEDWVRAWRIDADPQTRQRLALRSPLLQRACDAYLDAFRYDMNHSYAGLNALTLLTIQVELAKTLPDVWAGLQADGSRADDLLRDRERRIGTLVHVLSMSLEAEGNTSRADVDPWFNMMASVTACILSDQPEHVGQLFMDARHFAPINMAETMQEALSVYADLGIQGKSRIPHVGTIDANVKAALEALRLSDAKDDNRHATGGGRIVMFLGLRLDGPDGTDTVPERGAAGAQGAPPGWRGFPATAVEAAREAIENALADEMKEGGSIALAIASGAQGGDLLFHEICSRQRIAIRLCLPLPRPLHIGRYVATAGREWVERFRKVLRYAEGQNATSRSMLNRLSLLDSDQPVHVFAESPEMPRWLSSTGQYNVGRRNNLWILQRALALAEAMGGGTEVTLLALTNDRDSEGDFGGIKDVCKLAMTRGVKVRPIEVPQDPPAADASGAGRSK